MLTIRTIINQTDFSDSSKYAFRLACSLARDHHARLLVVHVIPEQLIPVGGVMTPPPAEEYIQAREYLAQIQSSDPKVRLERRLLTGEPVEEICRLAEETQAGLIVLGTHGRTGLSRLLMGSVAEHVVRTAACPVLTVRTPVYLVKRQHATVK